MRRSHGLGWSGALVLLVALALPLGNLMAEGEKGEIGPFLGLKYPSIHLTGEEFPNEMAFQLGLRLGWDFGNWFGWFVDGAYYTPYSQKVGETLDIWEARTGPRLLFGGGDRGRWYLDGAVGYEIVKADCCDDDPGLLLGSVGFGRRQAIGDGKARVFFEVRGEQTFDADEDEEFCDGEVLCDFATLEGNIGATFGIGGPCKDDDVDGVCNGKDKCPDTLTGCNVDEKGCPFDSDGDGVCDGLDACPETPAGCPVDAKGCPLDTDGDGVWDCRDKCASTITGCSVDADGCPKDTDGDGVCDGLDTCASTLAGCRVDAKGCPIDSDGDGVCDGLDNCASTPKGCTVDAKGCQSDADGDGVCDGLDKCANTERGAKVGLDGCTIAPVFIEPGKSLVLKDVNFEFNKSTLTLNSKRVLDTVAETMIANSGIRVEVEGHTDDKGSDAYNLKLSDARAKSVHDYLVSKGVPDAQMDFKGYGESRPIADNKTEEGRAQNRRVELRRLN